MRHRPSPAPSEAFESLRPAHPCTTTAPPPVVKSGRDWVRAPSRSRPAAWGIARRQFSFVAYAAVYGYVGLSSILIRNLHGDRAVLSYFFFTGVIMVVVLVLVARRFARES